MPESTVIPVLGYADVRRAVEWLADAFGFSERLRIGDHRSQLDCGDGSLVVAKCGQAIGADTTHSVMVRIAGIDAHFSRATAAGATVINPPTTFPYGERQYSVADIEGHVWTFSETLEDVDPSGWGGELYDRA